MDITAALAADLAVLTQVLDNPHMELETQLKALTAGLKLAVDSFSAMTMTIALDGHDVSFTVHDDPTTTTDNPTSLLIPLAAVTGTHSASTLVLYAATPGAFVDLAADLSYALGIAPTAFVLDAHLLPPIDSPGMTGLNGRIVINQAIGVLLERGHTPESADDELHRLANLDHGDLRGAAELILSIAKRPPDQG